MVRPTRGQVDRFTWAVLLFLLGIFLLISNNEITWIGFLIAAGLLIASSIYKQSRGWGIDVLGLIFGIVLAALGLGQHYMVDIPWIAIGAIAVSVMLFFDVFKRTSPQKTKNSETKNAKKGKED
jgi:4-hydroxybenzoate polyprenyltransferase